MGKEVPVPGIVITLAEPSATYRTQQFMEACAPLFLELVESAQAFHYTFSEGASSSLEVFSANSKGIMDFSGLYAAAQRHALLPCSLGSMTVTDAAGVRRDLTEGCSVKLVYFIYDENGQDTGFRLNILDNTLYLVCSSQAEGIEHIFRLCPDPVPDNRGEKPSQG